ncbi:MAG: DUF427 domain-containing protein [Bacteroidetes bacterium]|nr:DUF427 domain-containing protein [Bacteroidota bacterium]
MSKVIWNGIVVAESDKTIQLEGKKYFPHTAVHGNYFIESEKHSVCPVKGKANYYHVEVNGKRSANGAYYFPNPNPKVKVIQNYIGFGDDFKIVD